jgi:hypothetical protein
MAIRQPAAGSWLCVIAESESVTTALLLAAIATGSACQALVTLAQLKTNLDPLRINGPPTAVPVQPRSGPVVVTVEYIIHQQDISSS